MRLLGPDGEGWEPGERVPPGVENFFYNLMLAVGEGDEDDFAEMYRCFINCYPAPVLAGMLLGMAAMAHDLWTEGMTPDVIVKETK